MLETPTLFLLPWTGGPEPRRAIRDAAAGTSLGLARWRVIRAPWWSAWLVRPVLEIRETEDESLLCTVAAPRLLVRAWTVQDADGQLVGTLRGNLVLDRFGRAVALVDRTADVGHRFVGVQNHELAVLGPAEEGSRLAFAAPVTGDPFAKMLLLAAALVLTGRRDR